VRTPVIALFVAADPSRTGPIGNGNRLIQAAGLDCVPCRSRKCGNTRYLECMERITVDEVFEAAKQILDQGKPCVS
jgi:ADP-heptose:LPS heptosyltransferase